eukprot:snap_masked-scaffold_1-processed-gene-26.28-mRNA-1 protein AED:1.00 eAED:1.00 QI:0/-1/0/0/-1/1/1/0/479
MKVKFNNFTEAVASLEDEQSKRLNNYSNEEEFLVKKYSFVYLQWTTFSKIMQRIYSHELEDTFINRFELTSKILESVSHKLLQLKNKIEDSKAQYSDLKKALLTRKINALKKFSQVYSKHLVLKELVDVMKIRDRYNIVLKQLIEKTEHKDAKPSTINAEKKKHIEVATRVFLDFPFENKLATSELEKEASNRLWIFEEIRGCVDISRKYKAYNLNLKETIILQRIKNMESLLTSSMSCLADTSLRVRERVIEEILAVRDKIKEEVDLLQIHLLLRNCRPTALTQEAHAPEIYEVHFPDLLSDTHEETFDLVLYVDGSFVHEKILSSYKHGFNYSGWAVVGLENGQILFVSSGKVVLNPKSKSFYGAKKLSSSVAEITACIEGLNAILHLKNKGRLCKKVAMKTDFDGLVNQREGNVDKRKDRLLYLHVQHILKLLREEGVEVTFQLVEAHSGNPFHDRADRAARKAASSIRERRIVYF